MQRTKDITVKVSFADDNLTNFQQLKRGVDYDIVRRRALGAEVHQGRFDRVIRPG